MRKLHLIKAILIGAFLVNFIIACLVDSTPKTHSSTKVDIEKTKVYLSVTGEISQQTDAEVFVFSEKKNDENKFADIYLGVCIAEKWYTYSVGYWEHRTLKDGRLCLLDVDGDSISEILFFLEVTGNGGTIMQIIKWNGDGLVLWEDIGEKQLDLCFEFENNYKMIIENKPVGFRETIDVSLEYAPSFFDEFGRGIGKAEIFLLPIRSCSIVDDTTLLLPEIHCLRDAKCTNYIGCFSIVFQYDISSQKMAIKQILFTDQ